MFPIIPYNLNQSTRSISYSEVYNNSYKLPKVIAVCDIPRDTVSEEIFVEHICGKLENTSNQLEIGLNNNKLELKSRTNTKTIHWIRSIRLADDCHNFNAKLCMQNQFGGRLPKLLIQITKPIKTGQELLLWFSEDILANLQMAFLTPANIQGQKKYVCNICSTTFEYPNPLKLHLSLDCGKQQIHTLWDRLARSLNTQLDATTKSYGFQLKLHESTRSKNYTILNLSKSNNEINKPTYEYTPLNLSPIPTKSTLCPNYEIQRPYSEPSIVHSSAFKPYPSTIKKLSPNNNTIRLTQSISNFTHLPQNLTLKQPQLPPPRELVGPANILPQNFSNIVDHAAQMETIVSNLGKSKQGHLCIYCGKCYSRKYGLKIHIRTHTGYKPLKCKFCLRPFGDPSNLNKHVRLHAEGDTPYKCDLCGKVLVRRRDLERHLRSRHMSDMHLGEQEVEDSINSSSDHSED